MGGVIQYFDVLECCARILQEFVETRADVGVGLEKEIVQLKAFQAVYGGEESTQGLKDNTTCAVVAFVASDEGVGMLKVGIDDRALTVAVGAVRDENVEGEGEFFEIREWIVVDALVSNEGREHIEKVAEIVIFGDRFDDQPS